MIIFQPFQDLYQQWRAKDNKLSSALDKIGLYLSQLTNQSNINSSAINVLSSKSFLSVTTKGDLQGFDTIPDRVPVGTDGQVLTADSTNTLGVSYKTHEITIQKSANPWLCTPTGARAIATVYHNTTGKTVYIRVSVTQNGASPVILASDSSNPPTTAIATVQSAVALTLGFELAGEVLNGNYVTVSAGTLVNWIECQ